MRTAEQCEVLGTFLSLLEGATGDGGRKRAAGLKPSWKVDGSHLAAAYRHLDPSREAYDEDSGLPKEVHAAWRLLAVAWQRMRDDGLLPDEPGEPTALAGPGRFEPFKMMPNPAATMFRLHNDSLVQHEEAPRRYIGARPDTDEGPKMMQTNTGPLVREHRDGTIIGIVDLEEQARHNWEQAVYDPAPWNE